MPIPDKPGWRGPAGSFTEVIPGRPLTCANPESGRLLRHKRRSRSLSLPDFGEGGRAKARSGGVFGRRLCHESKNPTPALPETGEGESGSGRDAGKSVLGAGFGAGAAHVVAFRPVGAEQILDQGAPQRGKGGAHRRGFP